MTDEEWKRIRNQSTHLDSKELNSCNQDSVVLGIQPLCIFSDKSTKVVFVDCLFILDISQSLRK